MVLPRQFDVASAGNVLGKITTRQDVHPAIAGSMHYQGGDVYRRQNTANVNFAVHAHEGLHSRRACAEPLETGPPVTKRNIVCKTWCEVWHELPGSPRLLDLD